MLETFSEFTPDLYPFVYSAYAKSSSFFLWLLLLEEGIKQGDFFGSLFFCLIICPLMLQLRSELQMFHLDDETLGGNLLDGHHDLQIVERLGSDLGVQFSRSKSELLREDLMQCCQQSKVYMC